jgi:predicted dehydrogenase
MEVPDGVSCVYGAVGELHGGYDAVFITNPTSLHHQTLMDLMPLSQAFFLEKPAFDRTDYDISSIEAAQKTIYVACPLRYTAALRWVHDNVDCRKANGLRAISSSYLPEWRPGTDYRESYSAHRAMGGGVSIDLIHEWDYLTWLVGFPQEIHSIIAKRSDLEIDSDDVAVYIADYGDKTVELHLDYYGRVTTRRLEVFLPDETLTCDLVRQSIQWGSSGNILELGRGEVRDDWQSRELETFLDVVAGTVENPNDLKTAVHTLRLAKGLL